MRSKFGNLKNRAIVLRKNGKTYGEIREALGVSVPKSTLSYWCKNILLSRLQKKKIQLGVANNIQKGQMAAVIVNRQKRQKYLDSVKDRVKYLGVVVENKNVAKIALAMLYLGEGAKANHGSLMFGNSGPEVASFFLKLLRRCYAIDEKKFRCTVQCRADHNVVLLEKFWSKITKIPSAQFYRARIDPRTIGKISRKSDYKGVCRIDYFSADIHTELVKIAEVIIGPIA